MQILLTNDDGITAPGLTAMWHELRSLGEVTVVAPETSQSATGHGITLGEAVIASKVYVSGRFPGYSIKGRPADCVKLAVRELMDKPPDLVVSGINAGANVGINVLYSGTIAAAAEAAFYLLPSVAISLDYQTEPQFPLAAVIARQVISSMIAAGLKPGRLTSVNIPSLEAGPPRGVRVVRQSTRIMYEQFVRARDPRGRTYFWLTGGFGDEGEQGSDLRAICDRYVAVTPIRLDMTNDDELEQMGRIQWPVVSSLDVAI